MSEWLARRPRVLDLAHPLEAGMPSSPNHPGFRLALTRRHGDMVRADGGSAASEMIVTGGHTGTHIDALAHVSHDGMLHGGVDANEAQRGGRFATHGVETLTPALTRGVLLDVAGAQEVSRLEPGYGIDAQDLDFAARAAGVEIHAGDALLVRTGWAQLWSEPVAFLGHESGVPGVDEDGARWIADRQASLAGSDTTAFEQILPGRGHALLPAHRVLLVERGIPILEMLDLEQLSAEGASEFVLVLAPLSIVGATGSPVRPLALLEALR